jgi:thymidylate synthase (FAD)
MNDSISVKLIAHTVNPAETVAVAGKGCYSARPACDIALTPEGIDKTLGVIHPSCYEHAVFTFSISGISRVTSHQLVRHRMASYSQQSQRYVKPKDLDKDMLFDYVMPESVSEDSPSAEQYEWAMKVINKVYKQLLGWGCPEEDARYILPSACTTSIVVTMNARELQHFCGLRRCTRAQWEIRELADKMAQAAEEACPELFRHFSLGPQCEQLGYCPEHKGCGRYPSFETRCKGLFISPELSDGELSVLACKRLLNKIKDAMDSAPLTILPTPAVEIKTEDAAEVVPGRIAGEMLNEWTEHNTIPIATKEDLAQQKERAEDAVAVAKTIVEEPDMPCCPRCGSRLVEKYSSINPGNLPTTCKVGCPQCNIWCGAPSERDALGMFMYTWGKDE